MRIATWNVNSLRTRMERVRAWIERHEPDVLCLQEIKLRESEYPREEFEALGYRSVVRGQKTYNGVAILSRSEVEDVMKDLPGDEDDEEAQARLVAGTIEGLRVVNVYVPNGQAVDSEKFPYKIGWLRRLERMLADSQELETDRLIVLGDFNIAPEERDLHDPAAWHGRVHFHPKEHESLARITDLGLVDLFRLKEAGGGHYSWWDYRGGGFRRDHGLRIDLLLGSRPVADSLSACFIDRDERAGEKPSDHAPVVADLA